jgi:hypothetical protein
MGFAFVLILAGAVCAAAENKQASKRWVSRAALWGSHRSRRCCVTCWTCLICLWLWPVKREAIRWHPTSPLSHWSGRGIRFHISADLTSPAFRNPHRYSVGIPFRRTHPLADRPCAPAGIVQARSAPVRFCWRCTALMIADEWPAGGSRGEPFRPLLVQAWVEAGVDIARGHDPAQPNLPTWKQSRHSSTPLFRVVLRVRRARIDVGRGPCTRRACMHTLCRS